MSLTSAVEKDRFAFAADTFYAQASNQSWHRRAIASEVEGLFHPTPGTTTITKDHPAHWYESQLIHYGLPPSKTKSVAKLRLLQAFDKGQLSVPQSLRNIETDLKKQWSKKERQAKKDSQGPTIAAPGVARKPAKGSKAAKGIDDTPKDTAKSSAKKRKRDKGDPDTAKEEPSRKKVATAKQARKGTSAQDERARDTPATNRKSTSRTTGRAIPVSGPTPVPIPASRPRQYARRSRPSDPGNRFDSRPYPETFRDEEERHPYYGHVDGAHDAISEDGEDHDGDYYTRSESHMGEDDYPPSELMVEGVYNVQTSIDREWREYEDHQPTVSIVRIGGGVWGTYDFGMFEGVIRITEPHWVDVGDDGEFRWRGHENSESIISWDDRYQTGRISLERNGGISGTFYGLYGHVSFDGYLAGGLSGRVQRNPSSVRATWDSYTEAEYEGARVARWH